MSSQSLLAGHGAVVSGGSRGIGRAVAELLCNLGAGVVVNGRDPDAVEETVAALTASGGRATAVVGAADQERIASALIEECMSTFGRLDTLINCAGIAEPPSRTLPSSSSLREKISVHKLNFYYADGTRALKDVSVPIYEHQVTAFIGPSGCGKSTLLRVMAGAYRDLEPASFDPEGDLLAHVQGLQMTSLVGMVDPPRDESKAAVVEAQQAHIRVRMVTGDDVVTGSAIAKQLGIPGEAILGADFAALSEEERLARIDDIGVVGRVAPEHKVLLAETLKKKGEVVAMTGDGVNDAPAIKAADIGIAMGSGTDVAKNAGRMILSDDNFATIVYAVGQGRKLYDNLTKYIRFVLLLLVGFVLTFLGATLLNIAAGEPFSPAQVLWIHFLANAPFGVALGFDKETPGLMSLRPRPRGQSVLTRGMFISCGLVGLFIAVANLVLIEVGKHQYGSTEIGQSMAFVAFLLMLIAAAFECRSEKGTVLTTATFDSAKMNWTALIELAGAFLATQSDFLRSLLGTTKLTAAQWGIGLLAAVVLLLVWELGKWIARRTTAQGAGSKGESRESGDAPVQQASAA